MNIIKITHKSYQKLNMQRLESHSYYELYFLFRGNRRIFINENSYDASPNTMLFISPNTLHKTIGNQDFERINVYVSKELLTSSNINFIESLANSLLSVKKEVADVIYNVLLNASKLEKEKDTENLKATTNAILFYLQSQTIESDNKPTNSQLKKIVKYINERFSENITIDEICSMFFISKSSLFRLFHQHLQCTVFEYILTLRLNHSKNLLISTSLRIDEIANICGFNSANYFSLMFKKKIKLSPTKYRKNYSN